MDHRTGRRHKSTDTRRQDYSMNVNRYPLELPNLDEEAFPKFRKRLSDAMYVHEKSLDCRRLREESIEISVKMYPMRPIPEHEDSDSDALWGLKEEEEISCSIPQARYVVFKLLDGCLRSSELERLLQNLDEALGDKLQKEDSDIWSRDTALRTQKDDFDAKYRLLKEAEDAHQNLIQSIDSEKSKNPQNYRSKSSKVASKSRNTNSVTTKGHIEDEVYQAKREVTNARQELRLCLVGLINHCQELMKQAVKDISQELRDTYKDCGFLFVIGKGFSISIDPRYIYLPPKRGKEHRDWREISSTDQIVWLKEVQCIPNFKTRDKARGSREQSKEESRAKRRDGEGDRRTSTKSEHTKGKGRSGRAEGTSAKNTSNEQHSARRRRSLTARGPEYERLQTAEGTRYQAGTYNAQPNTSLELQEPKMASTEELREIKKRVFDQFVAPQGT
ncbi:hypothetical protein F5Y16DRAFT_399582 [Xylariaceae sp. FL0255]|nr:hypothetical protein F5Y16DRAFT_399582 [Xylariaceae sp. FL0255]